MGTKPATRDLPPSIEQEREERERVARDALVDLEGDQSFPASDPPSWTLGSRRGGSR